MKKKQSGTECCGIAVHCAFDEFADVVTLQPNPRNPNKHGDKQVAMLAKIIRHQGWRAPVVVSRRSGFVVAGHGRLQAAALLQVEKVPVNYQDFATEADEWAHLVADNRIAELADMDNDALAEILRDLDGLDMDAELTGFDAGEIDSIIKNIPPDNDVPESSSHEVDVDGMKMENKCPRCGFEFNTK